MSDHNAGLAEVRSQYEALPYPPRKPSEERQRLLRTWLEDLAMMNHYCYAGRQDFRHGFRILVAGGGTGDATIFLAEQLKDTDAEIVHLDFSTASISIARERAAIRKLNNITFLHDSLLNMPSLDLGKFDYINCSGVLHHLADPDLGLKALRSVLKEDGAIGLMLYATIGRTGVYQMQELMRLVNGTQTMMRASWPTRATCWAACRPATGSCAAKSCTTTTSWATPAFMTCCCIHRTAPTP